MKYHFAKIGPLLLSLVLLGLGYPVQLLSLLFFYMLFAPKNVYISWLKFFGWISILPLCFILATPEHDYTGGFFGPHRPIDRALVTDLMAKLVVVLSLLFLALKYIQRSRQKTIQ